MPDTRNITLPGGEINSGQYPPAQQSDFVTVATSHGPRLAKRWYLGADGVPKDETYDKAKKFDFAHVPVRSLDDLAEMIANIRPTQCLILGKLKDGIDPHGARRRLHDHDDGPATIEETQHHWLPIDADDIEPVDNGGRFDPIAEPERAVACIIKTLPAGFGVADCIWQFTGSAGFKPGVRMRLYFWLSRPLTGAEMSAWLNACPIDHSIYTPTQPIYAAPPVLDGVADPVTRRNGKITGWLETTVAPPDVIVVQPRIEAREADPDFNYDTEEALRDAEWYIAHSERATVGNASVLFYKQAARLKDLGISRERAAELLHKYNPSYEIEGDLDNRVANAFDYGQNKPGCDQPKSAEDLFGPAKDYAEYVGNGPTGGARNETRTILGSDIDLAQRFSGKHGEDLRYVHEWGRWLRFDGRLWTEVCYPAVCDLMRREATSMAVEIFEAEQPQQSTLRGFTSRQKIAAAESIARGFPRMLTPAAAFDADVEMLNGSGQAIDLRTGETAPLLPAALCTKTAAVAPGGECPLWRRFLAEITDGDAALQAYLQRVAGYALTGLTNEHAMFFLYGTGANGKGVFLGTLTGILGDYAKVAPADLFIESRNDRHPTDMAMLQGARLVVAQETNEGRSWDEAKVKALTGGDPVTARFMRQDFFTYQPQFKILIASNHKPKLRSVDEAIRRRLHMIPFAVTIPADKRDGELGAKLKAEWPGILQWMIDGCMEWRRNGLAAPAAVLDMTAIYLAQQDRLAEWIEDRCAVENKAAWASQADLYASFLAHPASADGEYLSKGQFGDKLESHGFVRDKGTGGARGHRGIRLKAGTVEQPSPW